jgi:four helix bundle protein
MSEVQKKANELEERVIDFSVRIIKLVNRLPKTQAGKHIAGQILRCGTSPAPNYGETRGSGELSGLHSQAGNRSEGTE